MRILTVEIENDIALSPLQNLESMHVFRVRQNKTVHEKRKLSERFAGCLSAERTDELQQEHAQMRK